MSREDVGCLSACQGIEENAEADAALGPTHISLGAADSSPSNWREAV